LIFLSVLAYAPSFTSQDSPTVDEGSKLLCKPLQLFPEHKGFWSQLQEWIHEWFGGYEINWLKFHSFAVAEAYAQSSPSQIAEFQPKSYVVPIVNGVVLDVQQYDVSVNGYRIYNANITVDMTWDGTSAVDYFSVLNWTWHLQEKIKGKWMAVDPSMSISSTSDDLGCYVTRQGTLADGSVFSIKYSLPNNGELKFSLGYKPTATEFYRLWFEVKGLQDENAGTYLSYTKPNAKRVHFELPPYIGGSLDFDYNDIALTSTEEFDSTGFKYNFYIDVGRLTADGTTYTYDPTTVGTTAGQYATSLGNNRKLFRDAYGKYLALWKNANVLLGYCNNDPPTSGWTQNDLGSSFAVSSTTEKTGVAGAYDSTNDRLLVVFVNGTTVKQARITFTRDGSNNITGYTAGSVLTIDLTTATGGNSNIDAAYNPSAWMLHNGEVQVVAGGNSTAGTKTGRVYGWRVVFGSPPTFKDDAGTASTIDALGTEYTTNHTTHYPTIVQRTNSGTGQYDLWCFYTATDGTASHIHPQKIKATWSSPNWSWGSAANTSWGVPGALPYLSSNYDTANGLIVLSATDYVAYSTVYCLTINSSNTDSDISKTGLSSYKRIGTSLAINGSDYYVFYHIGASPNGTIYYIKRTGGSWGSQTSFASAAECYPSAKVDGAGNRIELIWTHYTGSAYNIYYDSISLAAGQNYVADLSQSITTSRQVVTQWSASVVPSQSLTTTFNKVTQWNTLADLSEQLSCSGNVLAYYGSEIGLSQSISSSWVVATQASYTVGIPQSIGTAFIVLTQWTASVNPQQSLTTAWNVLARLSFTSDLQQSISTAWTALTQTGYNVAVQQSLSTSWIVLTGVNFIVDLQKSLTASWTVLAGISYITDLQQSFSTAVTVLTQSAYTVGPQLSLSTSWTTLTQASFIIDLQESMSTAWTVIANANYIADLQQSLATTWLVVIEYSAGAPPPAPGPGYTIFQPLLKIFEGLLGAIQPWPGFEFPLPLTMVKQDVTIANMDTISHDADVALRVIDENNEEVWSMQKTYEDLKPGPSTYTVWIPIRKEGSYTVHMTVEGPSLSIHESRQFFTVTWLELWASTIIVGAVMLLILVAVIRRKKRSRRYY